MRQNRWNSPVFLETLETRAYLSANSVSLNNLPILNSLPGAAHNLYLDFNGAPAMTWGRFGVSTTPAYDIDGNPNNFSAAEVANVQEVWARVSEAYAPFNLNVTTQEPTAQNNARTARVVIGGNGNWSGYSAGGLSYIGTYGDSSLNTSFVFSANLGGGQARYVALAAAHEAGHDFGLQHQSSYSGGHLAQEYYAGSSQQAPIMGYSYSTARALWWNGPTPQGEAAIQDDLAKLGSVLGWRASSHGHTLNSAQTLNLSALSADGVLDRASDQDVFALNLTASARVDLRATVAPYGPMLDLKLTVLRADGQVVQSADSASLGESLSLTLSAGSYRIAVASHGHYGDVGAYHLAGSLQYQTPPPVVPPVTPPVAPPVTPPVTPPVAPPVAPKVTPPPVTPNVSGNAASSLVLIRSGNTLELRWQGAFFSSVKLEMSLDGKTYYPVMFLAVSQKSWTLPLWMGSYSLRLRGQDASGAQVLVNAA